MTIVHDAPAIAIHNAALALESHIVQGLVEQAMAAIRVDVEERVMHLVRERDPRLDLWRDELAKQVILQVAFKGSKP